MPTSVTLFGRWGQPYFRLLVQKSLYSDGVPMILLVENDASIVEEVYVFLGGTLTFPTHCQQLLDPGPKLYGGLVEVNVLRFRL